MLKKLQGELQRNGRPRGCKNVNSIYKNNRCDVKTYVMDDDASTKSVLRWSYKTDNELYGIEWPTTKASKLKKDNRMLNILHKPIIFLADSNHRVKSYARPLFGLGQTPKATSECI
jgi:hypothetical protein